MCACVCACLCVCECLFWCHASDHQLKPIMPSHAILLDMIYNTDEEISCRKFSNSQVQFVHQVVAACRIATDSAIRIYTISLPAVLCTRRHWSLWFCPVGGWVLVWTLQSSSLFQSGKTKQSTKYL